MPHINHIISIARACRTMEGLDLRVESHMIMGKNLIDIKSEKIDCVPGQPATASQYSKRNLSIWYERLKAVQC